MVKFKKPSMFIVVMLICISIAGIVSAATMTSYHNVNLTVANANHTVRFQDPNVPTNTYNYFSPTQSPGQGLNALHICNSINTPYGQVTNTSDTSGTFYMSDTGGRGWDDDGILMIAVNGTLPEDFSVEITSSGYQWDPVLTGDYPEEGDLTYVQGAISETFDASDFNTNNNNYAYGPQTWKPCTYENYAIYDGQNVATSSSFSLIFVDLYAGIIGTGTQTYYGHSVTNNGMLKIDYTINNLPSNSLVAFNSYAYCQSSNQGEGIRWTNSVNQDGNRTTGTSGYSVASWF